MEKLEKHIKDKLGARKISPSNNAWEQVASSLGEEGKKKNRGAYWYAIAATLIGFLIISVAYFNTQNKSQQRVQIVDVDNVDKEVLNDVEPVEIVDTNNESTEKLKEETKVVDNKIVKNKTSVINQSELAIVEKPTPLKKELKDSFVRATPQDLIIEKKVSEVLATVINLENESLQVTDAEVDSLLRVAQLDILKERVFQDNGKVDAMALLTEAEDELDQSFRDKIFTKLKEGLFKARTAVADRNN